MRYFVALGLLTLLFPRPSRSQEKACILVQDFSTSSNVSWPYDTGQMAQQTAAELQSKVSKQFTVVRGSSYSCALQYRLGGEILEWHAGNRAKRMLVGMGSGRETAKIHFWLESQSGKRVFEHEDTIRAEFWGNAYEGSVGQLAHPLASKIADRIAQTKLQQ